MSAISTGSAMLAQLGIKGAALLIFDHGIGLSSDQWHRDVMSVVGHSRHSHHRPDPRFVRCCADSDLEVGSARYV